MHSPSRRRFLNRVTVAAGTVALGSPLGALAGSEDDSHTWRGQRRWVKPGRRLFPEGVASFDPRVDSVLLWTRLDDEDYAGQDLPVTLLVSEDLWLRHVIVATDLRAHAADGGVLQVKLTGLRPGRHYWYRFVYQRAGAWFGSPIGRTKTAPAARDASPVRFALANCQDAIGRYYNPYLAVLPQDLDFVLHVGDYIYETTGDPSFQTPGAGRGVQFSDADGAIRLTAASGAEYYAAASVSNYRELYRFYRSDPVLQRMHQRFPFVNIWDDHEYSDDCHGATATYSDRRRDERDAERRRNAERVFFEYIAVDDDTPAAGQVDLSSKALYPDTRLYRSLRYGRNLDLFLTDSRTFRPDHLIPEDAFPGAVAVERAALTQLLGLQGIPYELVKNKFAPYLDLSAPPAGLVVLFQSYRAVLTGVLTLAYVREGLAPADAQARAVAAVGGKLDANVVNSLLAGYNAASDPDVPLIGDPLLSSLDRGISFALLGKLSLFSSLGARYFVVKDTYDLYAAYRSLLLGDDNAENVYGTTQMLWLESALKASDARWKLVANSTSLTGMVLDLTGNLPGLPDAVNAVLERLPAQLRNRFYLNVDQIDGFPNFKRRLLDLYSGLGGVALVAGDIHASFATAHPGGVWEFTAPAVSSRVFLEGVRGAVLSDPTLSQVPGLADLVAQLDTFLVVANPEIRYANTAVNGVVVLEVSAARINATYWQLDGSEAAVSYYDRPLALARKLGIERFAVRRAAAAAAEPRVVSSPA